MKFDNSQFESNVKSTMSTLDKLKSALHFNNAGEGLENLGKTCDRLANGGFGAVGNAVETVHAKFSALEVIGMTALANITNSAVDAGKRIVDAITLQGARDGFAEYELKMDATRTIMASTGEDLDTVNEKLEELNRYADQTIYSFSDMTQNIGKFTNAGVELNDAVGAIKGVSSAAALAGANSEQASRAMYNFAQALSSGSIRLADWRSIENATMDTVEFKDELIKSAVALGKLKDNGDGTYQILDLISKSAPTWTSNTQNFRESLAQQWLTSEVLIDTLNRYSDASTDIGKKALEAAMEVTTFTKMIDALKEAIGSGWATTFELIFGDLEEAKKLWTGINNVLSSVIQNSADSRNKAIRTWKSLDSGMERVKKAVASIYNTISKVTSTISDAFKEVFNYKGIGSSTRSFTRDFLRSITNAVEKAASIFRKLEGHLDGIRVTAVNVFKAFKTGADIIKAVTTVFSNLVSSIYNAIGGSDILKSIAQGFNDLLVTFTNTFNKNALSEFVANSTSQINSFVASLKAFVDGAKLNLSGLKDTFIKNLPEDNIFTKASEGMKNFANSVKESLSIISVSFSQDRIGGVVENFVTFFSKACGTLKSILSSLMDAISPVIDKIKSMFEGMTIGGGIASMFNAGALAIVVGVIGDAIENFADMIDKAKIVAGAGVGAITDLLQGLGDGIEAWEQEERLAAVRNLAISVGILAASIVALSAIDGAAAENAIGMVVGIMAALVGVVKALDVLMNKKVKNGEDGAVGGIKGFIKSIGGVFNEIKNMTKLMMIGKMMTSLSTALLIAAGALALLGMIPSDQIDNAIRAMTAIFAELAAMMLALTAIDKYIGNGVKTGPLIGMTSALLIAALSLKLLSTIPVDKMNVAIVGMTAVLGEMIVCVVAMNKLVKRYKPEGVKQLLAMSSALLIAALSLKLLSTIPVDKMNVAIVGMTAVLGEMAACIVIISKFANYKAKAASQMIAMSAALLIASVSLKILASIGWNGGLAAAITAMTFALGELAACVVVLDKFGAYNPAGAASMIAMSAALLIASASMKILASMGWDGIGKAIVGMTFALGELVAACILLSNPASLAGAAAMVIMATGLIALGVALKIVGSMSVGEIAKAIIGIALALVIFGVAGAALGYISPLILAAAGAVALLGAGLLAAGAGVALFAVGLAALAEVSKEAAVAIVDVVEILLGGLINLIPNLATGLVVAVNALADALIQCWPAVEKVVVMLLDSVINIIMEFTPKIANGLVKLLIDLLDIIDSNIGPIISKTLDIIDDLFAAVADGLSEHVPVITDSIKVIFEELFGSVNEIFESVFATLGESLGKILGSIIEGFAEGFAEGLKKIGEGLSDFMDAALPFFVSLELFDPSIIEAAKNVAEVCLIFAQAELVDGIGKFLSVFSGGNSMSKFGKELAGFGKYIAEFSANVEGVNATQVSNVAKASKGLADFANAIPNDGGLIAKITGDNSLSVFAENLTEFAKGLAKFNDEATKISDISAIILATKAGSLLVDFAKTIPNEGGLVSKIVGDNSLGDFAYEFISFGTNLRNLVSTLQGITDSDINNTYIAVTIGEMLTRFASTIPNEGGLVAKISGDNSLRAFATEMALFGIEMQVFLKTINGVEEGDVDRTRIATAIGNELVNFASNASKLSGLSKICQDNSLANLPKTLSPLGEAINVFVESISGIEASQGDIDAAVELLEVFNSTAFQNAGKNSKSLTYFANGITDLGNAIYDFLSTISYAGLEDMRKYTEDFLKVFFVVADEYKPKYADTGTELFTKVIDGASYVRPNTQITTFVNNIINILNSVSNTTKFYNAGKNAAQGFANGMSDNSSVVTKAAEKMAGEAIKAAQRKLDEHSPSKAFYQIGDYAVQGLANALSDGSSVTYGASEDMAGSAIDGLKNTISKISDYIQNGLSDEHLTITPVLDLSNINSGMSAIDSMFAHEQAMSIAANGFNGNAVNGTTLNQILAAIQEFGGFNVVMDTGATVGALAPTMNSALGQISYREARR